MKMQRVWQFFQAIFARFDEADRRYVACWLPEAELQQLFYGMALPDQVHALRTAYTRPGYPGDDGEDGGGAAAPFFPPVGKNAGGIPEGR